ncbi:hypothetical protein ScPMuIL_009200 [Solemya velum]
MWRSLGSMSSLFGNTVASTSHVLNLVCQKCRNTLSSAVTNGSQQMQVRTKFTNWHMLKDHKRRQIFKEHGQERMRVNAIRKNNILPKELQEVADKEIQAFPRDSCISRIRGRCVVTSRPRGVLKKWRLSRIMWRHLADYNYLSGVTRSSW